MEQGEKLEIRGIPPTLSGAEMTFAGMTDGLRLAPCLVLYYAENILSSLITSLKIYGYPP